MADGFVHGDQDHTALHGEPEEVGIGDLLGAVEPREEWAAQGLPVSGDGQVVVPRLLGHSGEDCRGLTHGDLACTRRGRVTEKAGLGKRADGPLETRGVEPLRHELMVHVIFGYEGQEDIHIEQVARSFRQSHPRTLP